MTEELTNSNLELNLYKQNNDLIKLETNLQIKFVEEKAFNLEKKNFLLENELKEMNKKIQKINSDYKNEIEEMKQNFKKLMDENNKKTRKLIFCKKKLKRFVGDLIKSSNLNCIYVNFVEIKNKWYEIDTECECCDNNCINTDKPIGNCIEGNGFVNLTNDDNISWVEKIGGKNATAYIYAENQFKKPQNCLNYSLYYFEIKCKFEVELDNYKWLDIGLKDRSKNEVIIFDAYYERILKINNEKDESSKLLSFTWNNNDIFGCGLVYPPTNKLDEEFPYVFFTQNGKQIGKAMLVKENFESYKPHVLLKYCSVEANFGNNLETKPFCYDITKHFVIKEFYEDSDVD
uniref:Uncharacterized protein n=1 Tax=Meloidogyne enterolobii TaxID=390850 RepID=A0A6V7VX73_MELEN|nr:unnamed protein product [Meloidogyne enterolobii]